MRQEAFLLRFRPLSSHTKDHHSHMHIDTPISIWKRKPREESTLNSMSVDLRFTTTPLLRKAEFQMPRPTKADVGAARLRGNHT